MDLPEMWRRHILPAEAASVKALNRRALERMKEW